MAGPVIGYILAAIAWWVVTVGWWLVFVAAMMPPFMRLILRPGMSEDRSLVLADLLATIMACMAQVLASLGGASILRAFGREPTGWLLVIYGAFCLLLVCVKGIGGRAGRRANLSLALGSAMGLAFGAILFL